MDSKELIDELKDRLNDMKNIRIKFEPGWSEAQHYIAPSIYPWSDRDAIPETPVRFASEPCKYMKTLVSGVVGYSISPAIRWFSLGLEDQDILDEYMVKDFLEDAEVKLVAEFNRSNLYRAVSGFIEDAMILGHGVLLIDEDKKTGKLRYNHQKAAEIYMDIDASGEVDTVFREYRMSLRQMVQQFGLENLCERMRSDYKDPKKRNNRYNILFAVLPREEFNEELDDAKNKPYAAYYIDLDNNHIIQESGYEEFPYAIYLFKQITGYAYSESLAKDAIPDVKFLNVAKETSIRIAQTSAEPPMKASSHLKQISVVPRGLTLVEKPDDVLEPIKTGENYPITLEVVQQILQTVKDWFNVDFFLMLERAENKQMTATEVMERQGEKAAILSDLIVSLNNALGQIIKRSFNILNRQQKFKEIPEALAETAMKIEYEGPLAQAQKKYYSTGTIQQGIQAAAGVMQLFPESADWIDQDELMKKTMENTGMPQSVIREDRDVEKIRKERAQAQQQAMQQQIALQQQQNLMQNADKLGKAPEDNSFMQELMNEQNSQLSESMGMNR